MIQINQCKLPITHSKRDLEDKIRKILQLNRSEKFTYQIRRRSLDARKKPRLFYVYQLWVKVEKEEMLVKRLHVPSVQIAKELSYAFPEAGNTKMQKPPVVIGAGPGGLFAAYLLTEMGFPPIVLERGRSIEKRQKDVEEFWKNGVLDPDSNVQFGEGGAGTFSDGKLNTAVKDPSGRIAFVLETFVKFGAPQDICYEQKPHIGTDILSRVIVNMRNYLIQKGCSFHFETCLEDFVIEGETLKQLILRHGDTKKAIDAETVILAIGHSARDTFRVLESKGIPMEAKNFAVGFRVEHPQRMINEAMYGISDPLPLPAAPYKVTSNFPNGRGVYSFCMCPGGYVVNSSSGEEQTVVNGMSYSGRNGANANSAIIISVSPQDFGASGPLAGMQYQIRLERQSYRLGQGKIPQQLFGDYRQGIVSHDYGEFVSQTRGASAFANLRGLFSEDMERTFLQGMDHFANIIPGFDRRDAILSGVESRTSSPVRILRNERLESRIRGIYPCGEGAGYAGGIVSAAVDGLKVAEAVINNRTI